MGLPSTQLPENIRRCMPAAETQGGDFLQKETKGTKAEFKRERELQENVAALLRQKDIVFFRQRMDRKSSGTVGWPDFTFAVNGRACGVECKLPGCAPTVEQVQVMGDMLLNGWHVTVVESERALLDFLTEVSRG